MLSCSAQLTPALQIGRQQLGTRKEQGDVFLLAVRLYFGLNLGWFCFLMKAFCGDCRVSRSWHL